MAGRNGTNWTREETILAFELYCRTPFGKISQSNREIIELASLIGRTPSSVALKMHNLAHYDPRLRARNVSAMSHGSRLDPLVFDEYYKNLEELTYQASIIKNRLTGELLLENNRNDFSDIPPGEYKEQLIRTRLGQNFFRAAVLNSYGNRCCITGLSVPNLLIASHIKPWSQSDAKTERTNPQNGLCLNPFHDRAFDQGLITIDKNYQIIISSKLSEARMDDETQSWFMGYEGKTIILPDKFAPGQDFIEYHNDVIFKR